MDLGVGREELGRQARRDLVQIADAAVQQAAGLPVRPDRIQLVAQAVEVVVDPLGQARVGLDLEVEADKAAGRHVEGIAGREVPAVRVLGPIERGPGHIGTHAGGGRGAVALRVGHALGNRTVRLAADIAAEHDIRQGQACEDVLAVAHIGGADVEADIRRVYIRQALQADAVEGRIARVEAARAADADAHIGLDGALDQVAVGLDDALAVGVDDQHVVQAQRHMAQVEHGADVRRVQHLPALGLDLELARPGQFDQGTSGKARALDVHRHPAVIVVADAALIGRDLGDGQRQQVGPQGDRRGGGRLARAHEHVVVARLGGRDQHLLVGADRVVVGGVIEAAGGHIVPADVDLVGTEDGAGVEQQPQGFAGSDADLVEPGLAGGQRRVEGLRDDQAGHIDLQAGA